MPWRHFTTFTSFRNELTPGGTSQNATSAWQPWQSVCKLPDHSLLLPCLYNTKHWAIIIFGEAALSLESHWKLQHSATNQAVRSRRLKGGSTCEERVFNLLVERRAHLCREMRRMTAVAQRWLDTWRGHGEVISCSSGVIKVLFHMRHLRDFLLLTPRTFPCTLL